ncbi:MAG: hypothetical protein K940chlam3_00709 [Chlamydiae bacterium]|nr:hypothetical protein [Chlamydiota bacterium]
MDTHIISDYYFFGSALPPIHIGEPVELSFQEFKFLLEVNLNKHDQDLVGVVRRFYDIQNMRYLWMGQELDPYGILSPEELDDSLVTGIGIPDYVYEFVEKYDEKEDRLRNFPALVSAYFQNELPRTSGFLHEYLVFEQEWRLVFAALRAKHLDRNIMLEFQFEDPNDELVSQIIAQKDSKSYEPPARYEKIKALYETYRDAPVDLYQALAEYRFSVVDERLIVDFFSIERIIGYLVQLIIAEKWLELDKQKGLEILDSIVKEKL